MKIPELPRSVWFVGAAALLLPVVTGTAVMGAYRHTTNTAESLQKLLQESHDLSAELLQLAARSPDPQALRQLQTSVDKRCADAQKPAIVVADLSAVCDRAAIRVESIRPVRVGGPSASTGADVGLSSGCELTLGTDCASLGRLLEGLRDGRLPLRVTSLNIDAEEHGPDKAFGRLHAEVGVEAFRSRPDTKKEVRQ